MTKIMTNAHKMAKEIKEEYPEVDYRTQLGLCMSYLLNKGDVKMTNTWLTAKGAKIELTTEHVTTEIIELDGHKASVKADRIEIINCTVDGEEVIAKLTRYQNKNVLNYGTAKAKGITRPLLILVPDNVYETVWGEYDRRVTARAIADMETEGKYQKNYNRVLKAMK